jgi:hypothetical protein
MGVRGYWHERLPHFRPEFMPGEEGGQVAAGPHSHRRVPVCRQAACPVAVRTTAPTLAGLGSRTLALAPVKGTIPSCRRASCTDSMGNDTRGAGTIQ